eukprot:4369484-Pyramimonas_sp.AAC.1
MPSDAPSATSTRTCARAFLRPPPSHHATGRNFVWGPPTTESSNARRGHAGRPGPPGRPTTRPLGLVG